MFKKTVQRGRRSEKARRTFEPYVEPLSDARTKLAGFFNILLREGTGVGELILPSCGNRIKREDRCVGRYDCCRYLGK